MHARGQVVHLDVPASAYDGDAHALGRRLAGVLPPDIGIRDVGVAPPGFDARFSPLWRRYAYRVSDHPFGPEPLRRHDVLGHRRRLDDDAMNEAAHRLLGEHDFAAFCRRREGATTVRTPDRAVLVPRPSDGAARRPGRRRRVLPQHGPLAGRCLLRGRRGPARRDLAGDRCWPGGERLPDVSVAPARGLTLEEVRYPTVEELADRAAATRRKREVPS